MNDQHMLAKVLRRTGERVMRSILWDFIPLALTLTIIVLTFGFLGGAAGQ